ncbi:MAG TPA: DMT family transporter [Opitutaceae bacterium]|nr:DMT family transporter [Opitutaceae bacterium]
MIDRALGLRFSRREHVRGIILMLASTAFFTANVLIIRELGLVEPVNIWLVSCARFAVGIGFLAVVYRHEVQFTRVFRRRKLIDRGVIGGLSVALYYVTVVHLGAGRATFINNTYIAIGALLAVWLVREPFRPALAFGGLASLAGVALLTDAAAGGFGVNPYDLLGVVTAIGSAYVVVTIRQLHSEGETTATIFAAQCVHGLIVCAIPGLLHLQAISWLAGGLMIGAGICAAIGQIAMTAGFRHLPVGEGSLLQILVPLGIAGGGYLFFGERFTPHEVVGAALIVAGIGVTALRR